MMDDVYLAHIIWLIALKLITAQVSANVMYYRGYGRGVQHATYLARGNI